MRLEPLGGSGVHLVRLEPLSDARGLFARVWCAAAFAAAGIDFRPVQANWTVTARRGTVRGMHLQRAPMGDAKLVRVSRGCIHDVVVDLRPGSPSLGRAFTTVLDPGTALYVPAGFAHGHQALADDATVEYLHGEAPFSPDHYDGFRPDDPLVAIEWPEPVTLVSDRDLSWPPLAPRLHTIYGGGEA